MVFLSWKVFFEKIAINAKPRYLFSYLFWKSSASRFGGHSTQFESHLQPPISIVIFIKLEGDRFYPLPDRIEDCKSY